MHVCTYRGRDAIPSLENKLNDLILLSLFLLESARGVTRMWMRTLRRVYVCLCARMLGQEVIKVFTSSSLQLTRHGNEAVSKLWASCVLLEIDCSYITTFLVNSSVPLSPDYKQVMVIVERKHPHGSDQRMTDKTTNRQATCQQSTQTITPNCQRQYECRICSLTIDESNPHVKQQAYSYSLVPRLSPRANEKYVLLVMESWAGPGNEASRPRGYVKSLTAQDAFWSVSGLISWSGRKRRTGT